MRISVSDASFRQRVLTHARDVCIKSDQESVDWYGRVDRVLDVSAAKLIEATGAEVADLTPKDGPLLFIRWYEVGHTDALTGFTKLKWEECGDDPVFMGVISASSVHGFAHCVPVPDEDGGFYQDLFFLNHYVHSLKSTDD